MARIRVAIFEADTADAGAVAQLVRLVSEFNAGGGAGGKVMVTPAAPRESRKLGRRKKLYACADFPGRTFTADQVRETCGIGATTQLTNYVRHGGRIGGKHVFTEAGAAEPTAAADTADGSEDAGETGDAEDGSGDDADDDDPAGWDSARLFGALKVEAVQRKRTEIRNVLTERYMPMVHRNAIAVHSRLPKCVDLGDLVAAGVFGLMDAIERYDPSRRVQFTSYAPTRIRGAISDSLREQDWVPRLVRSRAEKLSKAAAAFRNRAGCEANDEELAAELGLSEAQAAAFIADGRARGVSSINDVNPETRDNWDGGVEYGANLAADADPAGADAERRDWWRRMTEGMTRAERAIVVLYYRDDMTMKQVGAAIGVSESRVSQMMSNIIDRLRARAKSGAGMECCL
jgi:RNA polymerase sigma factor for flagellar operon FliA